ncbi:hypothetical protein AC578_6818 [Pseudocercospora eumusae]|uniref:Uncharacterized protein n=1 Tax=Pseudocercospora eumusae TaxID=321146 RepID=A0A139H4L8_9PEZI|nr:hypothetical protein AC578_6818 [Pseudocercospora eumusae]
MALTLVLAFSISDAPASRTSFVGLRARLVHLSCPQSFPHTSSAMADWTSAVKRAAALLGIAEDKVCLHQVGGKKCSRKTNFAASQVFSVHMQALQQEASRQTTHDAPLSKAVVALVRATACCTAHRSALNRDPAQLSSSLLHVIRRLHLRLDVASLDVEGMLNLDPKYDVSKLGGPRMQWTSARHAALLRAVEASGKNKIKWSDFMAALEEMPEFAGCDLRKFQVQNQVRILRKHHLQPTTQTAEEAGSRSESGESLSHADMDIIPSSAASACSPKQTAPVAANFPSPDFLLPNTTPSSGGKVGNGFSSPVAETPDSALPKAAPTLNSICGAPSPSSILSGSAVVDPLGTDFALQNPSSNSKSSCGPYPPIGETPSGPAAVNPVPDFAVQNSAPNANPISSRPLGGISLGAASMDDPCLDFVLQPMASNLNGSCGSPPVGGMMSGPATASSSSTPKQECEWCHSSVESHTPTCPLLECKFCYGAMTSHKPGCFLVTHCMWCFELHDAHRPDCSRPAALRVRHQP